MRPLVVACVLAAPLVAAAHARVTTDVTFDRDVSRVLRPRCLSCHGPDAEVDLSTYASARPWARAIRDEVLKGTMPPWPPRPGVGDFANDASLSVYAAALLVAWAEGGAPEGDVADLPTGPSDPPPPRDAPPGRTIAVGPRGLAPAPGTTILAVRPRAARGAGVEVGVVRADGGRLPLVWVPSFDPARPWVYRLRTPLVLEAGDRVIVWGRGRAELTVGDPPPRSHPR